MGKQEWLRNHNQASHHRHLVELISKVVVPDESIAMRVVGRTLVAEYREAHRRTDSTDRIQRQMAE